MGETDREAAVLDIGGPLREMRPLCFGRRGESGIGLDYDSVSIVRAAGC